MSIHILKMCWSFYADRLAWYEWCFRADRALKLYLDPVYNADGSLTTVSNTLERRSLALEQLDWKRV